jgi:hypothetical protein
LDRKNARFVCYQNGIAFIRCVTEKFNKFIVVASVISAFLRELKKYGDHGYAIVLEHSSCEIFIILIIVDDVHFSSIPVSVYCMLTSATANLF